VVNVLRDNFLHGIGPIAFANIIHVNHIRRFERLHLEYLEIVYARVHSPAARFLPQFRPFGKFADREGYAGYVPSPKYFRDFYMRYITSHAPEMDQYTAMLSAQILQIDHSFKMTKHIGYVNGVPVFGALHTSVNEYAKI
jgi:hypothetical protein